jgi:transcription elongation GreA/GreB family factor
VTQASTDRTTIWLTQEAFAKLQAELENLRGPVRAEIVARISAARDEGDLKENGGYHAAREEQGKTEARIRQLEDILGRAEVGETPPDDGVVEPGMKVTYKFVGGGPHLRPQGVLPAEPARLGDHRAPEGRRGQLRGPERQAARGPDRRRGPLHRLSPRAARAVTSAW